MIRKTPEKNMVLFLLSFLLIYGGFHLYFFLRARAALVLPGWALAILAVFLLAMIAAPILVRAAERHGHDQLAIFLAYVGYFWMGIVFVFAAGALAVDGCRLLVWLAGLVAQKKMALQPGPRGAFYLPLALSLFITIWGSFEAWNIRLEKVTLASAKIPASLDGFRIVQISDVHLGLIVRHRRLEKILDAVREAGPDILVSTGDLVDGQINRLEGLAEMLQEIRPRYGKFAVTGNHEFYAGLAEALAFTEKAGFVILRNRGTNVTDFLNIAGVDDKALLYRDKAAEVSEAAVLEELDRGKFTLLLKHRPEVDRASLGSFDLQLSGHTHKGQIFPFNIVTWLYFPIHWGCLNPVDHCYLYVSRGSGTWGPPVRFLSPPEVTLIELVSEKGGAPN